MTYRANPSGVMWAESKRALAESVSKAPWHGRNLVISCPTTKYDRCFGDPADRAVTVSFVTREGPREYTVSRFEAPMDNLWALRIGLDSMRLNELRGLGDVLREMYLALPAPTKERDPWEVLGLRPDADRETVDAVYRNKAKRAHPDAGGSNEAMAALNTAYAAVTREG